MSGVLFENSIVCLVVFVCCFLPCLVGGLPVFPVYKVWCCFVFARYFFWCLVRLVLIRIHLAFLGLGCFCLESLILAQDERWRRA